MNATPGSSLLSTSPANGGRMASDSHGLTWRHGLVFGLGAITAFHLAYQIPQLSFLIGVYLFCLLCLAELRTARQSFYAGLLIGLAIYGPHLGFFWTIFGWPAIVLWTVLAFWIGLFVALARWCLKSFGRRHAIWLLPCLWTSLEYFRGELYYLRFTWLNVGYAFSASPRVVGYLGMYGVAFVLMLAATTVWSLPKKSTIVAATVALALLGISAFPFSNREPPILQASGELQVAGAQLEAASEFDLPRALDKLIQTHPETELIVLSEYTFLTPPPEFVKKWCRENRRYLIAGGKEFITDKEFYNTAFVVDRQGEIVFRQVKSVPVQYFDDGLPAKEQKLWESPWGKIGLCICYDFSYRRVTDRLIALGAEAIMVITADDVSWGAHEHRLHARVAPVRAAEYGVPIFRVSNTGISQLVTRDGQVTATAPFPGNEEIIAGRMNLAGGGRLPLDHWLAPFSVVVTALALLWSCFRAFRNVNLPNASAHRQSPPPPAS